MKKLVLTLGVIAAMAAAAAHAETAVTDTNGDGVYSMEELKAAYPEMTDEMFADIDADQNGVVSPDELSAAQEDGVLGE